MRYQVEHNFIEIIGNIWMPNVEATLRKDLSAYDVESILAEGEGEITREAVALWLDKNACDFRSIRDFHASIGDLEIPWESEEAGLAYLDIAYREEA